MFCYPLSSTWHGHATLTKSKLSSCTHSKDRWSARSLHYYCYRAACAVVVCPSVCLAFCQKWEFTKTAITHRIAQRTSCDSPGRTNRHSTCRAAVTMTAQDSSFLVLVISANHQSTRVSKKHRTSMFFFQRSRSTDLLMALVHGC